jgi:error-prone DNA polymerase
VINNGGGYYSSQTYLNECKRMGFDVLAPDINRSRMHYAPEGNAIRIGFRQLRELRGEFIQTLLRERRQGGEFRSFVDFLNRCAPRISDLRILVRSGALDSLSDGVTRPALFWIFFRQSSLGEMLVTLPLPASIGDYSEHTKLLDEVRTLGVMVSRHPLELFARRISSLVCPYPLITSKELAGHRMRRVSIAGLLVTGKEVWTRTNEVMTFVSFEDRYSVFESVFFPAAFRRFCHLLDQIGVFLLSGRVDEDHGVLCINVENLARLSGSDLAPRAGSFRIVSGTQKGPVVQWPVPANPLAAKTRTSI